MRLHIRTRSDQRGAYLLEALIGILIFSLGTLGIVGLQAASTRTTTDSSLRAEAVFAASQLMGQMWSDAGGSLVANYSSATAGASYANWASQLKAAQGGAWTVDPTVDFASAHCQAPPSVIPNSNNTPTASVYIEIAWQSPDGGKHYYRTCGMVGLNVA